MSGYGILSLTINERAVLHAVYMPFIKYGALFIPTERSYQLGNEMFLLIKLMEQAKIIPVAGKVIWITPKRAQGSRVRGIGVQFIDPGESVKSYIENYLVEELTSDKVTHTL